MILTNHKRILSTNILAILAFLTLMAYAPKLWIAKKAFPQIPLFDFIALPSYPFDYIFSISLILLLISFMIRPKKIIGLLIIGLFLYLAMVDQNRLQPYFYQTILTIFIVSYLRKSKKNSTIILHCLMFIFVATYVWSGIHKLNYNFFYLWDLSFAKPDRFGFVPEIIRYWFVRFIPIVEIVMGLCLLFNKTRKLAVFGIVIMHICIVGCLWFVGYGFNVVPWNLQNILSVIILFWSYKYKYTLAIFTQFFNYKKAVIMLFAFVLPATNLFGLWDHLLSFSFFSAKLNYYYVELHEQKLVDRLPKGIQHYIFEFEGKKIINLNDWCGDVNGVLIYPQDRVALKTEKYLKSFAENHQEEGLTKLVEYIQHKKKPKN